MDDTDDEQRRLWNGPSGRVWVEEQATLDAMFKPLEDLVVARTPVRPGCRVLDIGCGTGSLTVALARRVGVEGRCTGIDISAPMLEAARARAARANMPARFLQADPQRHAFEPASLDALVSRFGVMFFSDPVRAFANMREGAADDARLSLVVWRSGADNPFMTTAERAAAPLLPDLPAREPNAPGQFAFADRDRVRRILEASGWTDVALEPVDAPCAFPESGLERYFTGLGPVGRVLRETDDATRARVVDTVRDAFTPYVRGGEVRFTAACWLVSGRAAARR
ncbi:class I SAM-dependent methyltransferase [Marinivivus vitaminiproducens]|uniref:class I SAM-dependent methyltransferase n=1 Tax=Marinivivus vitaminiproducens TaxID=3035935 RepID=UPI0027A7015C|nr:methyltransferase domain-containing protein [Geminicoccaceae bacterium SCSIO 64248]